LKPDKALQRTVLASLRPARSRTEMTAQFMEIKVKPRARSSELVQAPDGTWLARLKSPPVDGKANEELVALVAEHFKCRKTAVSIKSGASGRTKLVKIQTA
jgi:uncharacterized protein (TIGR00251 family)